MDRGDGMTISHGADGTSAEERLARIEEDLGEIRETLVYVKEHIVKSAEVIEKVGKEVMPTLDNLMKSPMLKMLIGKQK